MYWSFADMNVGELIPIDAIVKLVVAPYLLIPWYSLTVVWSFLNE